jgi:CRP-like cAMP-binding protein
LRVRLWPKGSVVIHQGDYGDKFYVILEGKCVVKISEDPELAMRAALALELQAGPMA